jgi:methylglutaconyl-CoA hydratase
MIRCDEQGSVWRLSLSATPDGNAASISFSFLQALNALIERARQNDVRVLVLSGSEAGFCRGMDLDDVAAGDANAQDGVALYARCIAALCDGPFAVVSLIDGPAIAGGLGLVAAADIAICTQNARFALSEVMLGLLPAIVLPLLQQRMPEQKARALALEPSGIDAERACSLGLIDVLCNDDAGAAKGAATHVETAFAPAAGGGGRAEALQSPSGRDAA